MIYQNKYCQGHCVNLRPCHTPPFPPCFDVCPNCQNSDEILMFLIGYTIGRCCK